MEERTVLIDRSYSSGLSRDYSGSRRTRSLYNASYNLQSSAHPPRSSVG